MEGTSKEDPTHLDYPPKVDLLANVRPVQLNLIWLEK